jgi:hypothetical protein
VGEKTQKEVQIFFSKEKNKNDVEKLFEIFKRD